MKRLVLCALPLAATLAYSAPSDIVRLAEIRGTIDPASANYLKTSVSEAERENAQALVVELDTPGGLVSSVREMAQTVDQSRVPVIIYVTPAGASATSAGALLMLASHIAVMAPGTNIGAAHPVGPEGKDIEGAMKEKAVNDTAAFARGLAELRGRNRELAEKVVSKSRSFTAQEALGQGLIEVITPDLEDLLRRIDGRTVAVSKDHQVVIHSQGAEVRKTEMSWGQRLLHLLANPNIATLLMAAAVLCLYIEITTPGVTIPGVIGGIALIVAFMSFQMLPIRLGGLVLLLLGVAMLVAEALVVSHGALAVGGIISFLLGILWVMDPAETTMRISPSVWIPVVVMLGCGVVVLALAATRLRRLVGRARSEIGGSGPMGLLGYRGQVTWLDDKENGSGGSGRSGRSGMTHGKARIRGETWDFECEGRLTVGDWVEVRTVHGMTVVVHLAER